MKQQKINLDTVCFTHGRKVHCVFADSDDREDVVLYCDRRLSTNWRLRKKSDRHCKECTKQLRRAGMSWRWYEKDKFKKI